LDTEDLKASVINEVDTHHRELDELSHKIHANPELGLKETKASGWLTEYLEQNGFTVERGICGLPTAFSAIYGKGKPAIAILAEYDALPGIGHACGHNIIATSAVGAGIASRPAVNRLGGSVMVIGTPAEELYGGKVVMIERKAFYNVDIAMMVHPGVHNTAVTHALACETIEVEFFGKAAHAASRPEAGINALDAMIQAYGAINSLRQHIKSTSRIHGIITDGGEAANIVPAHSAANFIVRAEEDAYLDEIKQRVIDCFTGAAVATGARLEYRWGDRRYSPMRNNLALARLFAMNMKSLGRTFDFTDTSGAFGSTDMGNVSQILPAIHPIVAIAPPEVVIHSPEFALAAASETASRARNDASKALAMTVVDLLASPDTLGKVKEEFTEQK